MYTLYFASLVLLIPCSSQGVRHKGFVTRGSSQGVPHVDRRRKTRRTRRTRRRMRMVRTRAVWRATVTKEAVHAERRAPQWRVGKRTSRRVGVKHPRLLKAMPAQHATQLRQGSSSNSPAVPPLVEARTALAEERRREEGVLSLNGHFVSGGTPMGAP